MDSEKETNNIVKEIFTRHLFIGDAIESSQIHQFLPFILYSEFVYYLFIFDKI